MNHRRRVLYIGGYGRSGSTIFEMYLAERIGAGISLGECVNLATDTKDGIPCQCGAQLGDCEFWGKLIKKCIPCSLSEFEISTRRFERYLIGKRDYSAIWVPLLEKLFSFGDDAVLIDSSKTTGKTRFRPIALRNIGFSVNFVFLYRSPESVLHSIRKGSNRDLELNKNVRVSRLFLAKSVVGWFAATFFAFFCCVLNRNNSVIVKFEDFLGNPDFIFRELVEIFAYDVSHKLSGSGEVFNHAVSGNRVRRSGAIEIKAQICERIAKPKIYEVILLNFMNFWVRSLVSISSLIGIRRIRGS